MECGAYLDIEFCLIHTIHKVHSHCPHSRTRYVPLLFFKMGNSGTHVAIDANMVDIPVIPEYQNQAGESC